MAGPPAILSNPMFNMVLTLGCVQLAKPLDMNDPDIIFYLRVTYVVAQLAIVAFYYLIIALAKKKNGSILNLDPPGPQILNKNILDTTPLRYVEPAKPSLSNPSPDSNGELISTTHRDYDIAETKKLITSSLTGIAMIGFLHLQFKFVQPLLIQSILPIKNAVLSKPARIYLWGEKAEGDLKRPFKVDNPLAAFGGGEGPKTDAASIKKAERNTAHNIPQYALGAQPNMSPTPGREFSYEQRYGTYSSITSGLLEDNDMLSMRSTRSSSTDPSRPSLTTSNYSSDYGDYPNGGPMTPSSMGVSGFSAMAYNGMERPSDAEVERLFDEMMIRRGITDSHKLTSFTSWPIEKKWLMVSQDKEADKLAHGSTATPVLPRRGTSAQETAFAAYNARSDDKSTPEWYIKRFMDPDLRNLTPKVVAHLAVSLRTMQLSWVRHFIESRGLQVISNALGHLNRRDPKREGDLAMEVEIIKCLKSLLNNRWGAREAVEFPQCIYNITASIKSPPWATRKLVCEVLTFICYCDGPDDKTGHEHVLKGMDLLRENKREYGRFDAWLRLWEQTIDGRGRLGSLVGASEEIKKLGVQNAPDNHLMEYALSNMILVNSIIGTVDDVELRFNLRNQMNACGLQRILEKMENFNYDLMARQLSAFRNLEDADKEEFMEYYNQKILNDMTDPYDVFQVVLSNVEGTRAYDFFLSALQHMLLIKDEGEPKVRYFQLFDHIVTQVVLDRKGLTDDFATNYGMSVGNLIAKFAEQDQVEAALEEARQAREAAVKAIKDRQELELEVSLKGDGLVGELKAKTNSLEDLLRISRHTIATLQEKLRDLQSEYHKNLAIMDSQMKHFYETIKRLNGEGDDPVNSSDTLFTTNRKELVKAYDRLKAQQALEGHPRDATQNDENSIPIAQGLSEAFKQQLQSAIAGSGPPAFAIPGQGPSVGVLGSAKRHHTGQRKEKMLEDTSKHEEAAAEEVQSPTVQLPIEVKPVFDNLVQQTSQEVDDDSDGEADKPLTGLAAALQERLRKRAGGKGSFGGFKITDEPAEENRPKDGEPKASKPPPPPPPPPPPQSSQPMRSPPIGDAAPPPPPPPSFGAVIAPMGAPTPPPPPPPGTTLHAPPLPPSAPSTSTAPIPPPPPTFTNTANQALPLLNRKSVQYQAKGKLKGLQWEKIAKSAAEKTVFGKQFLDEKAFAEQLQKGGIFENMEDLFAQKPSPAKVKIKKERKQEISVIDPKKAYNMNITMLVKFKHISFAEVRRRILSVDESFCTEVLLTNLHNNMITPEEIGRLSVYSHGSEDELENLAGPDLFCLEMMKVYRYKERIENMLFQVTFDEKLTHLKTSIKSVLDASVQLKESKPFSNLLQVLLRVKLEQKFVLNPVQMILFCGNYMNGSSFQGGAFGFKIASINKLVDTKATQSSSTTLLHFLVEMVETNYPDILNFIDDLKDTGAACRVIRDELILEYNQLRSGLEQLTSELENHYNDDDEREDNDLFAIKLGEFRDRAVSAMEDLETTYTSMDVAYRDCVAYFGEDPTTMKPDEFFSIFKAFTASWEKAMGDNSVSRKKKEQAERAKKIEEEQKERIRLRKAQKHNVDISDQDRQDEDDKYIMDNLLEKLRAGEVEANTKKREARSIRERRIGRSDSVVLKAEDLLKDIQKDDDSPPRSRDGREAREGLKSRRSGSRPRRSSVRRLEEKEE
ncbi:hypothetical protein BZG36_03344 [Bifiguratus adelaidae]|uniref:FH2 domain-containing protein n=1 Tax=Bifiguratus adelaidae TaxID=1938954 RepID=A0A261XWK6_9FUNG|nr:hypothetical protein BZG36_03344 [Bifiguratus adelaidae]